MSPGVLPIISLASFPTARILLSATETATTEGSLSTIPFPGTKTRTVVVPRSIPSFGENENDISYVRALYAKASMEYRVWRMEQGLSSGVQYFEVRPWVFLHRHCVIASVAKQSNGDFLLDFAFEASP